MPAARIEYGPCAAWWMVVDSGVYGVPPDFAAARLADPRFAFFIGAHADACAVWRRLYDTAAEPEPVPAAAGATLWEVAA